MKKIYMTAIKAAVAISVVIMLGSIVVWRLFINNRNDDAVAQVDLMRGSANSVTLLYKDPVSDTKIFVRHNQGVAKFEAVDAPPNVYALQPVPKERERELNSGVWLILVYAVASKNDIANISGAIRSAEYKDGKIKIGLRAFYDYDESKTWLGDYGDYESPLWIIMINGIIIRTKKGSMTEDEINAFIGKST